MPERSSYVQGTPCWVDLQTTDQDGAKAFYAAVFGWDYDDQPMPHGHYSIAQVRGRSVAAIAPQSQELIDAGVPPVWNTYIAVDDVDASAAKVAGAGGQLAMEPFDVMEAGRMAFALDPSGAAVAFWQAGATVGAQLVNEPNALTWNELTSTNLEAALPFYENVLGITARTEPFGDAEYTMLYVGDSMVGGATPPMMDGVPNHWHVWFSTADADAAADAARTAGGSILAGPMDMPIGRFATVSDPQGAVFSVIATAPQP